MSEIMDEDEVTLDMPYNQGKWDSMMMLTLVMEIEAEYSVTIPVEGLGNVKTLADLYKYVDK